MDFLIIPSIQIKKNTMKYLINMLFALLILVAGCEKKDFDYTAPLPQAVITSTVLSADRIPSGRVNIPLRVEALKGLERVIINQQIDNGTSKVVTEITTFSDPLQNSITYTYNVPTDAIAGNRINLTFVVKDKEGNTSDTSARFTVNVVAAQFIRRDIIIGSTTVTEIAPVGTSTEATINEPDFTFEAGKPYLITGIVKIQEGINVNIQQGATLYGNTQFAPGGVPQPAVFQVTAGSTIMISGTKDAPVVMTSDKILRGTTPVAGDWHGLVLQGQGSTTNSGSIRYLRIEFGGANGLGAGFPDGSIVMQNIGSGTSMQYIQVFRGNEDGIRFLGGAPRIKYLVVTESNPANDNIRFGDGSVTAEFPVWGQFWVSERNTNAARAELDIRTNSYPTLMNITVTGPGFATGINNGGTRVRTSPDAAIGYRIFNSIFAQLGEGFRSQLGPVSTGLNGNRVVGHTHIFAIRGTRWRDNASSFTQAQFNNTDNVAIPGITPTSLVPTSDAPASTFMPSSVGLDNWFTATNFVGAIRNMAGDWMADGSWCKSPTGTIR
jgi:hypothetical protein